MCRRSGRGGPDAVFHLTPIYQTLSGATEGAGHWRQRQSALELTVHREERKSPTVPQCSDQQEYRASGHTGEGCFRPTGEKEERKGVRHLGPEVSLKSHLLGRPFARARGPCGVLEAGRA